MGKNYVLQFTIPILHMLFSPFVSVSLYFLQRISNRYSYFSSQCNFNIHVKRKDGGKFDLSEAYET